MNYVLYGIELILNVLCVHLMLCILYTSHSVHILYCIVSVPTVVPHLVKNVNVLHSSLYSACSLHYRHLPSLLCVVLVCLEPYSQTRS
jgi:hypothetical protein